MIEIRWRAWHGDATLPLDFPAGWQVTAAPMPNAPALTPAEVEAALRAAHGRLRFTIDPLLTVL